MENSLEFGCLEEDFGKQEFGEVKKKWSKCFPIDGNLECCGNRTFYKKLPCIKYKLKSDDNNYCEYSYPNALFFSFFLGIVGADLGFPRMIFFSKFLIGNPSNRQLRYFGFLSNMQLKKFPRGFENFRFPSNNRRFENFLIPSNRQFSISV